MRFLLVHKNIRAKHEKNIFPASIPQLLLFVAKKTIFYNRNGNPARGRIPAFRINTAGVRQNFPLLPENPPESTVVPPAPPCGGSS